MFRYILSLLGVLLTLPILALIVFAFALPITISGIGYLLAFSLIVAGLIIAPWTGRLSLILALTGMLIIGIVAGARLTLRTRDENPRIRVVTLPQGRETRWVNTLIDEQDSLIFGEELFHRIGGDSRGEHEQLAAAFHRAYSDMRGVQRFVASPVVSTYLNLQRPAAFDAVIIEPKTMRHPEVAVILLHGYMGNVTSQCWEIAQAVGEFGAVTVCPSTDWTGQWWQPEGQAILQSTFQYLRAQGIEIFYLGGFSNGGFGISRLVSKLRAEAGLSGLFFINGIADGEGIKETGLPILIIQGVHDERVPVEGVRPIAEIIGDRGTYVEVEGDHFMILKQPKAVRNAIAVWLENIESQE